MSITRWKETLLPGGVNGQPTEGYGRLGRIAGRSDLLAESAQRDWWKGEFASRAKVPHTTSAIEAAIRRRQLERLVESWEMDRTQPALELGCADGLVTRHLLELGFEKLVSTDVERHSVVNLDRSLKLEQHERVLLIVDDMLRLPFGESSFGTVVAWGVLSVTGDFDRALGLAWGWVRRGGYLLLAEPVLESVLTYTLVRGDLDEFRRAYAEGTRAAMWDTREDRYRVNPLKFYRERLVALPQAKIIEEGGINMLPSLIFGGLVQDSSIAQAELAALSQLLTEPELDEITLWRQAFWLVQKR